MVFSLSRAVENYNDGSYSSYPSLDCFHICGEKIPKEQSFPFCKLSCNIEGNPAEAKAQELSASRYAFAALQHPPFLSAGANWHCPEPHCSGRCTLTPEQGVFSVYLNTAKFPVCIQWCNILQDVTLCVHNETDKELQRIVPK